ncbi:MAG TPA: AIR synthase-related protein, partial [Thauera sp.]|nr:AIR synthase-related protein [Thauera sp.]
ACIAALPRPQPRLALGRALRGVASAMLDVSDGLLGDLRHILERSHTGALIETAALPLARLLATGADPVLCRHCLLAGGDDYELLFCAATAQRDTVRALATELELPVHRIGSLTADSGSIHMREADGTLAPLAPSGYDHFA